MPAPLLAALSAATTAPKAHTVSAWSLFTQLLIGMAVILVIIFVGARLLGGKGRLSLGATRRQTPVSVLARQTMGKGVSLAVVKAGTAVYLLGVTQHQVTRIDQLDPETFADTDGSREGAYDPAALPGQPRPSAPWGSWIRQLQERSVRR